MVYKLIVYILLKISIYLLCVLCLHIYMYLYIFRYICVYFRIYINVWVHFCVFLMYIGASVSIYFIFLFNSFSSLFSASWSRPPTYVFEMTFSHHCNTGVVKVRYLLIGLSNCLYYAFGPNSWHEQNAETLLKLLYWLSWSILCALRVWPKRLVALTMG